MDEDVRRDEMRVVIRAADAADFDARLVHASVFSKVFTSLFNALKAANKSANSKTAQSEFFISHLRMGSNEVGILEQPRSAHGSEPPSIEIFHRCAVGIVRNEFDVVDQFPKVADHLIKLGEHYDPRYAVITQFARGEFPIDSFFAKQAQRYKDRRERRSAAPYFAGSAIGSFDGTLGQIDYRGASWTGSLVLAGGHAQIECVFDKSKGEDSFNPFGNKRVSITGRAIYTGESQLPERIEVITIQDVSMPAAHRSIQGALTGKDYLDLDGSFENLH